ncbi:MAG: L-serine ammonia-lyase [Acidobacteriia bacterium]|nr:L-serine ammonia-lyase [Terriglobia bacterium]
MPVGVFDLFKIGIGPSSSHTVGPMKAAHLFARNLQDVARITATVYGSLAWTGKGHSTDKAITLGLAGMVPDSIDPDEAEAQYKEIAAAKRIGDVEFDPARDIVFDFKHVFPEHPNAMRFEAYDAANRCRAREVWFSVGGGFVVREGETASAASSAAALFPFESSQEMLALGRAHSKTIAEMALANELARLTEAEVFAGIDRIASVMFGCIERGLCHDGELPGALKVKRRAKSLYQRIRANSKGPAIDAMNYVSAFAIAVNEENAAGGRVVTAPTNGAAGVVPAVLRYYRDFCAPSDDGIRSYFLAAAAIGAIIKQNASISGAEMGCQGEVGSAAAMAAAGLAAALGATNAQIENAAEIAIEHHLGMTCDPVGGLVQIPCIERNAFGAVKAIQAASLAMLGDGTHHVTLDQVIETMRQTGTDMQTKYKETSLGGLAVNVIEC